MKIFIFLTLYLSSIFASENSIVPFVEHYEAIENLPLEKFTKRQLDEIREVLHIKDEKIRLLSFNILFNLHEEKLDAPYRWNNRYPRVVQAIQEINPDVVGVQELFRDQLEDILPLLDGYAFYAKPNLEGELNGIFYKKDRFECLEKTYWHTSPSAGFSMTDTITLVVLKDKKTGQKIGFFNTHLVFNKIDKREAQVRFIADLVSRYDYPVTLTGDFNTLPALLGENLPYYDGDYIVRLLTANNLIDARTISLLGHFGPLGTFTNRPGDGVPFKGTGTPGVFLDHIFVSKDIAVIAHAVEPVTFNNLFPSDHMPLFIDFIIKN